ncbi:MULTISPECIES: hypothetical protein [Pseudomonas]|uniref:Uncharacterized protein n=1 Tax=Pseudomonas helleri TaxID=1608996 RepID=A0A6L5HWW0_9PSED|nr:hypothetical protein [Pseudomonas helleri]MQU07743.1 hypothetical protein [Pseudomonas helleri]
MSIFNRKLLATAVLVGSMTLLAGCQEKIEAPSMSIMKASVQKVMKDMDPVEKVKFEEAFQTGLNYAYAKNHGGRTPEQNIGAILGQAMNGLSGKPVDTSADDNTERDILKMMDGKTASDVVGKKADWDKELVDLKAQWQKAQDELAVQRQKQIEENARVQKLEFARQRKLQLSQNIAQLEQNVPKLEAQISEAEILKKPFADAVADYAKVEIKNVSIKVDGPRKRFVEFDVVNGSQVQFDQIYFTDTVTAGSTPVYARNGGVDVPNGLTPGATYHISHDISVSGAFKYDPNDLTVNVKFRYGTDTGKKISVAENLDDAGWKHWTESNLVNAKNQLEQTKKRIDDYKKQLADMDQPAPTA